MVENIKIEKSLQPLSTTKRVQPLGHRQNNSRQNPFLKTFKEKQNKKKKKEKSMHAKLSSSAVAEGRKLDNRQVKTKKSARLLSSKKIIDVRV